MLCRSKHLIPIFRATLLFLAGVFGVTESPGTEPMTGLEFFEKRIRPILANNCYECHSVREGKSKGGLLLDSRQGWMKGGQSGPVIAAGSPHLSLLLKAVSHADPKLQMPPESRLSNADIRALDRWIANGAVDPRESGLPDRSQAQSYDFEKEREFWSFRPVLKPKVPATKDQEWAGNELDRFLLARMEAVAVIPGIRADRETWLRRVTFSLTGLPPTVREIGQIVADQRDDRLARAAVIDRLLESKAYGEHFARHWLDLVRYADTSGAPSDYPLREMWRYRDYVVKAFNGDLPFDQFVREQLAGDLLAKSEPDRLQEKVTATGYLALAKRFDNAGISKHLIIEDVLDNLGKTFLGLSIGCARCHDHKYDPIPAKDYYALYGIFDSTLFPFPGKEHNSMSFGYHVMDGHSDSPKARELFAKAEQLTRRYSEIGRQRTGMRDEIRALELLVDPSSEQRERLQELDERYDRLSDERSKMKKGTESLRKKFPTLKADLIYAVRDGVAANTRFQHTGDPEKPGEEVPRGFLEILGESKLSYTVESGRRELADWIASPRNPLTARVIVNRVWSWHFGRGLVETPNDFGHRGGRASYPALLDWLADWFIENDWSVKELNRFVLNSAAFAVAADPSANTPKRDESTTALQALFFLNSEFFHECADAFAERLGEAGLEWGFKAAYGHDATTAELSLAKELHEKSGDWKPVARMMLAANRFVYVE